MGNLPEKISQTLMDGALSARHTEARLCNRAALQNVIHNQQTAYRQKPQAVRQKCLILPLRRIHENHIIGAFQCRQNIRRITLQNLDFIL